jgi:hypothetical protein
MRFDLILPACLLLLVAGYLACCSMEHRELARISSPDQKLEAILVWEFGGGAAGSSEHYLYLVDTGPKESRQKPVWEGGNCNGTAISWLDGHTLQITYPSPYCTIRQFTNKWYSPSQIQNDRYDPVEIVLHRRAG